MRARSADQQRRESQLWEILGSWGTILYITGMEQQMRERSGSASGRAEVRESSCEWKEKQQKL
jgi:hypothetical protein